MSEQPPAVTVPDLDTRTGFLLSQLGHASAQRFATSLATLDLNPLHFGLLVHISKEEGQPQQRLADALGIHRNVMVGLIDDLETRGLVERRRHPEDRRAHAIHLTAAARKLLSQASRLADEHDERMLEGLSESDRAALKSLLSRLAEHAGYSSSVLPGFGPVPR